MLNLVKENGYLEADESDGSFKVAHHYLIITNIDYEHIDFIKI